MEVLFKFPDNQVRPYQILRNELIKDIITKIKIEYKPTSDVNLFYFDRVLKHTETIQSIGYTKGSVIRVQYETKNVSPQKPSPSNKFLPPRTSKTEDPSDFQSKVRSLMDIGFDQKLCERALRASYFNVDRAAEYLIEGQVPEETFGEPSFILQQRDIDISNQNYQQEIVQSEFLSFTAQEKQSILRIENQTKVDKETVVQVYISCEKNELKTINCLRNFN